MKLYVVSIFDSAAQAFTQPGFVLATGLAVREFTDQANKSDSQVSKHPSDYSLFLLGQFDDASGSFALEQQPRILARAVDVITSKLHAVG